MVRSVKKLDVMYFSFLVEQLGFLLLAEGRLSWFISSLGLVNFAKIVFDGSVGRQSSVGDEFLVIINIQEVRVGLGV